MERTYFKSKSDGVTVYIVAFKKRRKWYAEAYFPKKKEAIAYISDKKDEGIFSRINKWLRAR